MGRPPVGRRLIGEPPSPTNRPIADVWPPQAWTFVVCPAGTSDRRQPSLGEQAPFTQTHHLE